MESGEKQNNSVDLKSASFGIVGKTSLLQTGTLTDGNVTPPAAGNLTTLPKNAMASNLTWPTPRQNRTTSYISNAIISNGSGPDSSYPGDFFV